MLPYFILLTYYIINCTLNNQTILQHTYVLSYYVTYFYFYRKKNNKCF